MRLPSPVVVAVVLALPLAGQASNLDLAIPYLAPPWGMGLTFTVAGPPNTPFVVAYALGNVFLDPAPPIGILYSGQTDSNGLSVTQLPFQVPYHFELTEAQLAGIFLPPAEPAIVTELVQLTLTAGPAPLPAPCGPHTGAMTYDPATCTIVAKVKLCPGDTFEIKKNGVTIASGTAPASGEVVIALGDQCMGAGDVLTGVVNGNDANPFLGPIRN